MLYILNNIKHLKTFALTSKGRRMKLLQEIVDFDEEKHVHLAKVKMKFEW